MTAANIKKRAFVDDDSAGQTTTTTSTTTAMAATNGGRNVATRKSGSPGAGVWIGVINTIYDVIVFLLNSLGFVLQVRVKVFFFVCMRWFEVPEQWTTHIDMRGGITRAILYAYTTKTSTTNPLRTNDDIRDSKHAQWIDYIHASLRFDSSLWASSPHPGNHIYSIPMSFV